MTEQNEPTKCPRCGSDDRNKPKILPHPTEDAYCFDPWHRQLAAPPEGETMCDCDEHQGMMTCRTEVVASPAMSAEQPTLKREAPEAPVLRVMKDYGISSSSGDCGVEQLVRHLAAALTAKRNYPSTGLFGKETAMSSTEKTEPYTNFEHLLAERDSEIERLREELEVATPLDDDAIILIVSPSVQAIYGETAELGHYKLARDAWKLGRKDVLLLMGQLAKAKMRAEQSEARVAKLEAALRKLYNEVHGALGIAEDEIKQAIGVTNLRCIESRLEEARAALASTTPQEGEGK